MVGYLRLGATGFEKMLYSVRVTDLATLQKALNPPEPGRDLTTTYHGGVSNGGLKAI